MACGPLGVAVTHTVPTPSMVTSGWELRIGVLPSRGVEKSEQPVLVLGCVGRSPVSGHHPPRPGPSGGMPDDPHHLPDLPAVQHPVWQRSCVDDSEIVEHAIGMGAVADGRWCQRRSCGR